MVSTPERMGLDIHLYHDAAPQTYMAKSEVNDSNAATWWGKDEGGTKQLITATFPMIAARSGAFMQRMCGKLKKIYEE